MKHINKIIYLFLAFLAIMVGVVVNWAIHSTGIYSPWWAHILVVFGTIFFALAVHELAHAVAFRFQGIKIKAIYLFMFMFIKGKKFYRLKINPKLLILGGGLVVPSLPPITSDEDLEELGKKMSVSLITAPIVSIVLGILWFISFILILFLSHNWTFITISITSTIVILIYTILVILASKSSSELAMGDFAAYKMAREDQYFMLSTAASYLHFNKESYELSQDYIRKKSQQFLIEETLHYHRIAYSFIYEYLYEVVFEGGERNKIIDEKIANLNSRRLSHGDAGLSVAYLMIFDMYQRGDDNYLKMLHNIEKGDNKYVNPKYALYEQKRAHHLLNISDETEFLSNKKNTDVGFDWILAPVLEVEDSEAPLMRLKKGIMIPEGKFFNKIK